MQFFLVLKFEYTVSCLIYTTSFCRDGKIEIPVNAPDTITSWVLSAFAINPELGLSVAPTAKVKS